MARKTVCRYVNYCISTILQQQDDIKVDMDIQTMESDLSSFFGSVNEEPRSPPAPGEYSVTGPSFIKHLR